MKGNAVTHFRSRIRQNSERLGQTPEVWGCAAALAEPLALGRKFQAAAAPPL